jgi:hypothetical protein
MNILGRKNPDSDRLEKRAEVKIRRAQQRMADRKHAELAAATKAAEAAVDAAVLRHEQTCKPIQESLQEVERAAVARKASGEPADADLERRRQELMTRLDAANESLVGELRVLRDRQQRVLDEMIDA